MSQKKNSLFLVGALAFSILLFTKQVHAATGVTVSPTFIRYSVSDLIPSSSDSVTIKNNTSTASAFRAAIVDVDEATGTLLPLADANEVTTKVFSISVSEFTLQPDQSINVIVTVNNYAELSPGGHYAALYIQQISAATAKAVSPINQAVGVGLFLTKEDGAIRALSFSLRDSKSLWFKLPTNQNITIKNDGNVDAVPRGFIALTKGTKIYQKTLFNEVSQPVFPYKTKELNVDVANKLFMWPGKYNRVVSLRYEGQVNQQVTTQQIWYVPWWSIVFACLVAVVLARLIKRWHTRLTLKMPTSKKIIVNVYEEPKEEQPGAATRITIKALKDDAIRTVDTEVKPKKVAKKSKPKKQTIPKSSKKNSPKE